MDEYAKQLASWKAAYPYIANGSTGVKLGDYDDARRKFLDTWSNANPYGGPDPGANFSPMEWEQGWQPTAEDYDTQRQYGDWENKREQAWGKMLTPEQAAEYHSQKHDKYKHNQSLARAAFLAAAGAMAAPGLIGAMGAESVGGAAGAYGAGSGWGADTLSAMGLGGLGEGGTAGLGAGGLGSGSLGTEWLGGLGQFGGLGSGATGTAGAASSGGNLLEQILAGVKGLGGLGGGTGGGINWTNLLGNLAGGLIQSHASGKATDALVNAGNQSNALLEKMWQQGRADQAPYREAGTSALAGIQALLKDPSSIAKMPDYQFGLDQGNKALANSAAARGMTYSGQQGKALQRYGQDYAGTKLNDSYNRLASIAGIGQQATNQTGALGATYGGQMANTIQGIGNAQGSGYVGRGNAWNNAIGGALNGMSEQNLIDALLKRGGG